MQHGVSQHLVSIFYNAFTMVKRQGCVLSPCLFSAMLRWVMTSWRRDASLKGFDLGDGQPALLDLRFADDILLFAKSYAETVSLLHDLVSVLSQVGLILNVNNTVVLTNEARPPAFTVAFWGRDCYFESCRQASLKLRVPGGKMVICRLYAPHSGKPFDERQTFFQASAEWMNSLSRHGPLLALGDFNARLDKMYAGESHLIWPTHFWQQECVFQCRIQ